MDFRHTTHARLARQTGILTGLLLSAVLPAASCRGVLPDDGEDSCGQAIRVTLGLDGGVPTKATSPSPWEGAEGVPGEGVVANVKYFVWGEDGFAGETTWSTAPGRSSLSLMVPPGTGYSVYALVNTGSEPGNEGGDLADFERDLFRHDGINSVYRFDPSLGRAFCSFMGLVTDVTFNASSKSVTVPVRRNVSRLEVGAVVNGIVETAALGQELRIEALYVSNVSVWSGHAWTTHFHDGVLDEGYASKAALYEGVPYGSQTVARGSSLPGPHYFYMPANHSPLRYGTTSGRQQMKLVVKASLGGSTCYYPVPLGDVDINRRYTIPSITLLRRGTDSPNDPLPDGMASFSLSCLDWVESDQGVKDF